MMKPGDKHYFEYSVGSSSKFWEIEVFGPLITLRHGKVGTKGKVENKVFDDGVAALEQAQLIANEMINKGFKKIDVDQSELNEKSISASMIHFSNRFRDYTPISLLAYDEDTLPKIGDVVEINKKFWGIHVQDGLVIHVSKSSGNPDIDEIMRVMRGWDPTEEEIARFRTFALDLGAYENTNYSISILEFSKEISQTLAQRCISKFSPGSLETDIQMQDGLVDASLRWVNGIPYLNGTVRAAIDNYSVISSKAVNEFNAAYMAESQVENVAWSDEILEPNLLDELNKSLDFMCQSEPKDFHPGSKRVVRDIVHPSMYCYVDGVTPVSRTVAKKYQKWANRYENDFWGRPYESSSFQWLPAEFFVDESGRARIDSYINNLDPSKYPDVYEQLRHLFEQIFPLFETLCCSGALRNDFDGDSQNFNRKVVSKKFIPLRNRTLQVVTKIVEYRVNSEIEFDGVWHVEGMSHENILATGLCIIKRDANFEGAQISFKRPFYDEEAKALLHATPQNANLLLEKAGGGDVRPLGSLETPAGRAMVFPNSHIHRLSNMNSSDGQDAVRRIVVFWLVNPDAQIVSTKDVAPQQGVMKRVDAKKYRLALMKERKYHKGTFNGREVSLCEH